MLSWVFLYLYLFRICKYWVEAFLLFLVIIVKWSVRIIFVQLYLDANQLLLVLGLLFLFLERLLGDLVDLLF